MTNSELKTKISNSNNFELFNNFTASFNFNYVDFILHIKGLSAIFEFADQQCVGWNKIDESLPVELIESKTYFTTIRDQIVQFITSYIDQSGVDLNWHWQQINNLINNISQKPLPFHLPQTEFLIKIHHEKPEYFNGVYNYILGTNNYNINNRENLFGAFLAYEFTFKDQTHLTERRKVEQRSISKIRTDFQNYLTVSEKQLVDHLENANVKFDEYAKQIDHLKSEKADAFNTWFVTIQNEEWRSWYDNKLATVKKLEETYENKLKLEKPARYWEQKSTKYYSQGTQAKKLIIGVVIFSVIFLGVILTVSPDWIFKNVFKGNEVSIVRWSLVFITLLSLIAYTIKALSKYMFSSFHLARDAEERHTLTFFYLALLKDTEVKDDDRKMILQSLFSRTDTGLLKEDSGPTMPNDTISKILSK